MKKWHLWVWLGLLALLIGVVGSAAAQDDSGNEPEEDGSQFAGTVPAPDFPEGLEWLNVSAPLTIEALEGKIVVFDFWTYGCINCIHMIPILEQIEEKYAEEVIVIGVHSAKFDNESEFNNIQQIVQRYELAHPVINDKNFIVWQTYGVRAWPTFALIDPRGNVLAIQPGEIPFEAFDRVISEMVNYFDSTGEINRDPIDLALEGAGDLNTLLRYPGKVLVDTEGSRLFITDTNHNRIVVADLETYEVQTIIGTSARGLNDGNFESATFNKPQGIILTPDGNTLYVADTNNHAIRAIDLAEESVTTVAGTGVMGQRPGALNASLEDLPLRSPWDVELSEDGLLHVAMAGPHQIWTLDLEDNTIADVVGNGREAMLNNYFEDSELAQPSGLHLHENRLYFADSESSTIRVANFTSRTLDVVSGTTENNLFDFGDIDGELGTNRLQHPLGVTANEDGSVLYIADTYNSRIKRVDLETKVTETIFGLDTEGFQDGDADEALFYEPGGLDYADGKLYVADTNNHVIRVIDLEAGTVSTINFPNAEVLQLNNEITVAGGNLGLGMELELPEQTVAPGEGEIVLHIALPEGYKVNEDAPSQVAWTSDGDAISIDEEVATQALDDIELRVPVSLSEGDANLSGVLTIYYCEAINETLCFIDEVNVQMPVVVSADGEASELMVEREIAPPEQGEL